MPKVSVGIPTYNSQKFLSQAIDSVLNQTFQDFELIISDDASTDETPEIVANYAAKDQRIRYFKNPTRVGLFANFNKCIERSSGEYINVLGQDDVMLPKNIEEKVNILDSYPSVGLVASSVEVIDDDYNQLNWPWAKYSEDVLEPAREWVINKVTPNNDICCPFVFLRRQVIEKVGLFNCRYSYVGDFEMWLRVGLVADVYFLQEVLGYYRWHQSNESQKYDDLYYLTEVSQVWDDIINKLDLADLEQRNLEDRVVLGLFNYFISRNFLDLDYTLQICKFLDGWRGRNRDLTLAASKLGGYIQEFKTKLDWSQSQLQQTQVNLERSQQQIVAMQSSKFWQLRKAWFRLKQSAGLRKNE
ncbi:MAG: glycosyltransferase [Kastovskya adunca ATA6-11-RM4]|jgi:glycosyltransferase involved in cell wall biosynthesis|nr:glycosyltransferase [Kastovskya adunca ATA6-11-RM4]